MDFIYGQEKNTLPDCQLHIIFRSPFLRVQCHVSVTTAHYEFDGKL